MLVEHQFRRVSACDNEESEFEDDGFIASADGLLGSLAPNFAEVRDISAKHAGNWPPRSHSRQHSRF